VLPLFISSLSRPTALILPAALWKQE